MALPPRRRGARCAKRGDVRLGLVSLLSFLVSCQIVARLDQPLVPADASADASGSGDAPSDAPVAGYRGAVLEDKPIVYFRFGESTGTTVRDETANMNDGKLSGGCVLGGAGALKEANSALDLGDGTCEVSIPNTFDFPGTSPFTFEMWVLPETGQKSGRLWDKAVIVGSSPEGHLAFWDTSFILLGFERFHATQPRQYVHEQGVGFTGGVYNHLVFTGDGTNAPKMYLNGAAYVGFSDGTGVGPDKVDAPMMVGGGFRGRIDEMAIYDHQLSETRILLHRKIALGL